MKELRAGERARAHQVLDRLLELLLEHAPSSGVVRVRFDREGRLHLDTREIVADLESHLTPPDH